jgi:hypothetical protein
MFPHHPSPPSPSKVEMQDGARKEVGAALQKLGNQDLEGQKCWYNIDSPPTAHTFMFRVPWVPPSSSVCVKPFVQWSGDEAQKVCVPGHFARFLVCGRKFMPTEAFLFTYVCMWHTPRTSCTTSEVRPYARTELRVSCTGPWNNMVSPMNQITRQKRLLWTRRQVASEVSVLRTPPRHTGIGCQCNVNFSVVGSDLMWFQHLLMYNSWPSRCPSCDRPLLPCWKVWMTFLSSVWSGQLGSCCAAGYFFTCYGWWWWWCGETEEKWVGLVGTVTDNRTYTPPTPHFTKVES